MADRLRSRSLVIQPGCGVGLLRSAGLHWCGLPPGCQASGASRHTAGLRSETRRPRLEAVLRRCRPSEHAPPRHHRFAVRAKVDRQGSLQVRGETASAWERRQTFPGRWTRSGCVLRWGRVGKENIVGREIGQTSMPESPCGANHRHCQPTARLWGKSADEARFDGCVCFLTLEKRSRYTARRTPCDRVARRLLPRFRPASYKLARAEN